jgi:ribonuclease VapC
VIVVDASALLAIVLGEDDGPRFLAFLAGARPTVMSVVNYWEALVRARAVDGQLGHQVVDELLETLGVRIEAPDANLARRAAVAFERFRGRAGGKLNLGDTFAYALAEREGDGLLFKGNGFPETDAKPALP